MTRSRNRLLVSALPEFVAYCVSKGWESQTPKGDYEVARLQMDRRLVIVWRRDKNLGGGQLVHLTLDAPGERLFSQWMKERDA
jgi:hypothetical protein